MEKKKRRRADLFLVLLLLAVGGVIGLLALVSGRPGGAGAGGKLSEAVTDEIPRAQFELRAGDFKIHTVREVHSPT